MTKKMKKESITKEITKGITDEVINTASPAFGVAKAEAVYSGGGIWLFCGITNTGLHFIADSDMEYIQVMDAPTMTDEVSDEAWDNLWQPGFQEEHAIITPSSELEAKEWMLCLYQWLIDNEADNAEEFIPMRDALVLSIEKDPDAWVGYKASNRDLIALFEMSVKYATADHDKIVAELLRRMEDFTGEIHE